MERHGLYLAYLFGFFVVCFNVVAAVVLLMDYLRSWVASNSTLDDVLSTSLTCPQSMYQLL